MEMTVLARTSKPTWNSQLAHLTTRPSIFTPLPSGCTTTPGAVTGPVNGGPTLAAR
jgi:hypothetical protein